MNTRFYIEIQDTNPQELRDALKNAGLHASNVRPATRNHNGIILTETLAKGIWNHETGAAGCTGNNKSPCNHRDWDQLSDEQKDSFIERLTTFMANCRTEEFIPTLALKGLRTFDDVRLTKC